MPRQYARQARKAAGLPASSDVGQLASMILHLRSAVESHLGGREISGAVVTIPHLAALYLEDIDDALEYAGLISVGTWPYWNGIGGFFSEGSAVYTGNGFGLCSNYTDVVSCKQEGIHPPPESRHENVLSISYTRGLVSSTWSTKGLSFGTSVREHYFLADLRLGWEDRHKYSNVEYYWAAVRDAVITPILLANEYIPRTTHKITIQGEMALNPSFRSVINQAFEKLLPNNPATFDFDPSFAAARGAAEMAKRVYWRYNHTHHEL